MKGSTRHDILERLSQRVGGAPDDEFRVALEQACRIARFRLDEVADLETILECGISRAATNGIITEKTT